MVLYSHAEGIDEDGNHYPLVEVYTFHNSLQFFPKVFPGPESSISVLHNPTASEQTSESSYITPLHREISSQLHILYV